MARPEDLTVDYKKLLRLSVADRVDMARSPIGQSYLASLTPTQYNSLFPSYYKDYVPSYSAVSSGGGGGGGMAPSVGGGGGGGGATAPSGGGGAPTTPTTSTAAKPGWLQRLEKDFPDKTGEKFIPPSGGLVGGATIPKNANKETIAALNTVASRHGLKPEAIAMMINLESGWNTKNKTGSYAGLTQMGGATFREAGGRLGGMTYEEYKSASPDKQILAYSDWLNHYKFQDQLQKHKINLSGLSAAQQAAFLQGMQFSPNGQSWKKEFAKGNYDYKTTNTKQARVLGSTSINDMVRYYNGIESKNPSIVQEAIDTNTKSGAFPSGPPTSAGEIKKQPQQADDAGETPLSPTKAGKYKNENRQNLHLLNDKAFNPVLREAIIEGSKRTFGDPNDPNTRYEIRINNALRPGDTGSKHSIGKATDLQIYDRETGKYVGGHDDIMISSYGNPYSYNMHKDLSRGMYQFLNEKYGPDIANRLSWGGNFFARQGKVGGAVTYNGPAIDSMHYSLDEPGQAARQGSITGTPSERVQKWLEKYGITSTEMGDVSKWRSPYLDPQQAAPQQVGQAKTLPKGLDQGVVNYYNSLTDETEKNRLLNILNSAPVDVVNRYYTEDAATATPQAVREKTGEIVANPSLLEQETVLEEQQNATRRLPIKADLKNRVEEAVLAVYGPGYKARVYSGGQDPRDRSTVPKKASIRHNYGNAGDFYIEGPDGKRLSREEQLPLAQYWMKNRYGSIGLGMSGAGIHIDNDQRVNAWAYKGDDNSYEYLSNEEKKFLAQEQLSKYTPPYSQFGGFADKINQIQKEQGISVEQARVLARKEMRRILEAQDDASEKPLSPQAPTATVTAPVAPPPSVRFQDLDLGGAQRPNFTDAELEAINLTPGAAQKIADGIKKNPMARFATPSMIRSGVLDKAPDLKTFSTLDAGKQQEKLNELRQKAAQPAPTPDAPKTEQAPSAATPKNEQAPSAEPTKQEETPKAMATGGTFNIPPGENVKIYKEKGTGNAKSEELVGLANPQEYMSVENGRLKIDPATLVNNEVPLNAYAENTPQQQQQQPQYVNMAQMTGSTAPPRAETGFMDVKEYSAPEKRHLAQTKYDPYRSGTGFNLT